MAEKHLQNDSSPLFYDVVGASNDNCDQTEQSSPSEKTKDPESLTANIANITNKVVQPVATLAENTVGRIIPKIEPLPWYHFILLSIAVSIPTAIYIATFTKMGYGIVVFEFISRYFQQHAYKLGGSIAAFAFCLFLFDCYYWSSTFGRIARYTAISILVIAVAVLVCFIAFTHPYGPISMYVVLCPIWLVVIRFVFYRHKSARQYVPSLSGPLFFISMATFISWFVWSWMSPENEFTPIVKIADAQALKCKADFEYYPTCSRNDTDNVCFDIEEDLSGIVFDESCPKKLCVKVYDTNCAGSTFILWAGPFLVSLGLLFLSFFATFLKSGDSTVEKEAVKFAEVWGFLLFAMWISASLAGAGAGLSTTLAALTLSSFVASTVFLASSYSQMERMEQVRSLWQKLLTNYGTYLDVAKGLVVITCTPVAVLYLAVSFLIRGIRTMRLPCSRKDGQIASQRNIFISNYVTAEANQLIKEFVSWDLATVFTYAIYWGAGFITLSVIASKFTTLFLSWLITYTTTMDLIPVTGIIFGVGVVMFLLPPVPGAPIYLTLGIVVLPVGRGTFGIVGAIVYAMGVSLVLKLFATFLQQKMIGGLLKNNVSVRQLVGINTPLIRTMKLLLAERGLGAAKVAILTGGPDWPTSVLCGIMDLPLLPVLVGTLPVFILIVPTVLAGSFTYMASIQLNDGSPEFPWAGTASTICAALAAIVLFGCVLSAAFYVEKAMSARTDDLEMLEIDEAVRVADEKQQSVKNAYKEVTEWKRIPIWAQLILILSLTSMISSCYMIQLFQDDAFTEYQLTYTIENNLNGDWRNLVKPIGWAGLLLFASSLFLHFIFNSWAKFKARQLLLIKLEEQDRGENRSMVSVSFDAVQSIEVQASEGLWNKASANS